MRRFHAWNISIHNVETVASLRARQEAEIGAHQRWIERLTAFVGRPQTRYFILVATFAWIGFNLGASRATGVRAVDSPPFAYLQGTIGLFALLATTIVLTTQSRQSTHAERRAHLDLQVALLAEQKAAKLIALVEDLRADLPAV